MAFTNYRSELVDAVASLIGARGKSPGIEVPPSLNPTVDVLALAKTPFASLGGPIAATRAAPAVAAENSFSWVSPGINFAIEVVEFTILTTATFAFQLLLLTQAQQAAIGVSSFVNFSRLRQRVPGAASEQFPEATAHVMSGGSNAGIVGTPIGRIVATGNVPQIVNFRELGVALYGDDPGGAQAIQGLGVVCETVNTGFDLTCFAREWPRPT